MKPDWDLLASLLWDKDFDPYPKRIFFDIKAGGIEFFYLSNEDGETDAGISPDENRATRAKIELNSKTCVELHVPDHGKVHKWFREWLASQDQSDLYFGSIGGCLKQYHEILDRSEWQDFRKSVMITEVCRALKARGINLDA